MATGNHGERWYLPGPSVVIRRQPGQPGARYLLIGLLLALMAVACSAGGSNGTAFTSQPHELIEPSPVPTTPAAMAPVAEPPPAPARPQGSVLEAFRVISYYGHPFSATMGVLGTGSKEAVFARLQRQAAEFQVLDARPVKLAFHLIYAVAQASPGGDGHYLYRTDDAVVRDYIDFTRAHDMLLFIDLQNGRADVESEVAHVLPYLIEPHVHLALDPEFTMPPGKLPGVHIGTLDAGRINAVQRMLSGFIQEHLLPDKVLMVHQFLDDMVTGRDQLETHEGVHLVIDMDGFGDSGTKVLKYGLYATGAPFRFSAIKLFYLYDTDLMSPSRLLQLQPPPDIVIYQ